MAYTSVIPVHRLDRSIDYVKDKEKTTKSAGSLEEAIDYALNREKTEQTVFEDSIGCTCDNAYADMVLTKKRFHKTGGVQGYHLVQSFAKGEVTPELAHLIGQELTDQLLKGEFEVVITTHLNTSHYHNHLVWNSVSMMDGHKYHSNEKSYYTEVRRISDNLCKKYGLSVIQTNQGKAMHYAQWKAEKEGKPTWRTAIRLDIRESIDRSFSWTQFVSEMEKRGYTWKMNRKYIALKAPEMERYIRLRSLGKGYGEDEIREQILRPKIQRVYQSYSAKYPKKKLTGLQALYYSYLYRMGVLKKRPKRIPYTVRADIRKLDERIRQIEFLQKEDITTRDQLSAYRKPLQEQVTELLKERRKLYRSEPESKRLGEITMQLKELRGKIKLTVQIEKHSLEIEERLRAVEEQEKQTVELQKRHREEKERT
ncbi:relaxase/mobilization nuclease domain-containing protein [Mediterraneibacter gnavus]|uniref:relaxase/mobilization nuclease domain-containing protein n=1 Tax=Mediterraneibacter gnavus TaxID=33038 RepID=UPI003565271D